MSSFQARARRALSRMAVQELHPPLYPEGHKAGSKVPPSKRKAKARTKRKASR